MGDFVVVNVAQIAGILSGLFLGLWLLKSGRMDQAINRFIDQPVARLMAWFEERLK